MEKVVKPVNPQQYCDYIIPSNSYNHNINVSLIATVAISLRYESQQASILLLKGIYY